MPDEDAEKPEGWLDDEPAQVDDPGTQAPAVPSCTLPLLWCQRTQGVEDHDRQGRISWTLLVRS